MIKEGPGQSLRDDLSTSINIKKEVSEMKLSKYTMTQSMPSSLIINSLIIDRRRPHVSSPLPGNGDMRPLGGAILI